MKRGVILFLLASLIFASYVFAQQDELSVRFHSFGKNATIDLKQYLGESSCYLVSQPQNIIIEIDQEKGIATLTAKPGWEGSEVVLFRTNETVKKIENETEAARFIPPATEIPHLIELKVKNEDLVKLFESAIDPSMLDFVKGIKKEGIKNLSKEIREGTLRVDINNEVDLKMKMGYMPTISMDFLLGEKVEPVEEAVEEAKPEEGLKLRMNTLILIALLLVLALAGLFFYKKYAPARKVKKKGLRPDYTINKDVKLLSLSKLRALQKNLEKKEGFEELVTILKEFFASYFRIGHNFEFDYLRKRVKDSSISERMKDEISDFLNDAEKTAYSPPEKHEETHGEGQIPKQDLKKLILRLKRIIQNL